MNNKNLKERGKVNYYFNRVIGFVDGAILVSVALGTIVLAIIMLMDLFFDFFYKEQHTIPHYVSEFMFTLIIVELFRQVIRQINREPLSLNPFIYIGVISSIRGIIIMQMNIAMGEIELKKALETILAHGIIVLILFISYYLYTKINNAASEKQKHDDIQ